MNGVDSSMRNDEKRVQCRQPVSSLIHRVGSRSVVVDREGRRPPSERSVEGATACIDAGAGVDIDMSVLDTTEASQGVTCMMRIDVSVYTVSSASTSYGMG